MILQLLMTPANPDRLSLFCRPDPLLAGLRRISAVRRWLAGRPAEGLAAPLYHSQQETGREQPAAGSEVNL